MGDLTRPIAELATEVRGGRISAVDLVRASLARIAETDHYHAVLEVAGDASLQRASEIDQQIADGEDPGPLAGIPFIAKDNFLTLGTHTTAASNILAPFRAPYQAVAIDRLVEAGAVMVAKANLDAFAHGSSTENSDFGPSLNPIDTARVPGGSSGGSAAAVALGQASFALGTDTGGSIRQPASFCGVVGLKPTYGLVPRTGVVAMGSSVDVIGPITRRVADASLVLDVLAGRDASDSTTIDRDESSYLDGSADISKLRFGVVSEYLGEGLDPEVGSAIEASIERIKAAGGTVEEVSLPATKLALACYYILIPAEVSSNLARYDGIKFGYSAPEASSLDETYLRSRSRGFGNEAKRRIMVGTYVLSSGYYDAYYKRAQKVRTTLVNEFQEAFDRFDVLIGPTTPTTAFKLGSKTDNLLAMYASDVMTVAVNLVGIPAISIPAGLVNGLPVGLQIMAPQKSERTLLGVAAAIEKLDVAEGKS